MDTETGDIDIAELKSCQEIKMCRQRLNNWQITYHEKENSGQNIEWDKRGVYRHVETLTLTKWEVKCNLDDRIRLNVRSVLQRSGP